MTRTGAATPINPVFNSLSNFLEQMLAFQQSSSFYLLVAGMLSSTSGNLLAARHYCLNKL